MLTTLLWSLILCDLRRHLMFYEAVGQDDRRSIGLAVSQDGKADWQRLDRYVDDSLTLAETCSWMGKVSAPCRRCSSHVMQMCD